MDQSQSQSSQPGRPEDEDKQARANGNDTVSGNGQRRRFVQYNLIEKFKLDLLNLYESREDSDVIFAVNESTRTYEAHSTVIAARCRSLKSNIVKLLSDQSENPLTIQVPFVSDEAMNASLKFLYCGTISFSSIQITLDSLILSTFLGVPSLQQAVFDYLETMGRPNACTNQSLFYIMHILNMMLLQKDDTIRNVLQIEKLTECLATHLCHYNHVTDKDSLDEYKGMSDEFWQHVLKQDNYDFEEDRLWLIMKKDLCFRYSLTSYDYNYKTELRRHAMKYFKPDLFRILSFDPKFFALEIEPLSVYNKEELILKYRFDSFIGIQPLDVAFTMDRDHLLKRIRRRTFTYQCENHPYERGLAKSDFITLPVWFTQFIVRFDDRTMIGRYSQLNFYTDPSQSQLVLKIISSNYVVHINHRYVTKSESNSHLSSISNAQSSQSSALGPFLFHTSSLFYTFYSPSNIGQPAWGYKFSLCPIL